MQTVTVSNTSSLLASIHPHVAHCWPLKRTVFETHSHWLHTSPILFFAHRILIGHIPSNFPITSTFHFVPHPPEPDIIPWRLFSETPDQTSTTTQKSKSKNVKVHQSHYRPEQARTGPKVSWKLRFQDFVTMAQHPQTTNKITSYITHRQRTKLRPTLPTKKEQNYVLQTANNKTEQNHGMVAASSNIFFTSHYSTSRNSWNIVVLFAVCPLLIHRPTAQPLCYRRTKTFAKTNLYIQILRTTIAV